MNCTERMLFAWLGIWANDELPNAELAGAAHWTMLNRLSTSSRRSPLTPPGLHLLAHRKLKLVRHGDRTSGSVRGALPNWFAGMAERGLVQVQVVVGVLADAIRDVAGGQDVLAGDDVGPRRRPNRNCRPVMSWLTPIGNPLWSVKHRRDRPAAEDAIAPHAVRQEPLAFAERQLHRRRHVNLCGESSRLRPYSELGVVVGDEPGTTS